MDSVEAFRKVQPVELIAISFGTIMIVVADACSTIIYTRSSWKIEKIQCWSVACVVIVPNPRWLMIAGLHLVYPLFGDYHNQWTGNSRLKQYLGPVAVWGRIWYRLDSLASAAVPCSFWNCAGCLALGNTSSSGNLMTFADLCCERASNFFSRGCQFFCDKSEDATQNLRLELLWRFEKSNPHRIHVCHIW